MPLKTYVRKVLLIRLCDVAYGADLSRRLDDKDLVYYVECRGLERPLVFYVVGPDNALKSTVVYVNHNYNSKFRKVVATRSFDWKVALDSMDKEYCDHVLTSCTASEFEEKVREMYEISPMPCKYRHAKVLPVYEDTTVNGRYRPIVPYSVEAEDVRNDQPSMLNNEHSDIVCFCKCK